MPEKATSETSKKATRKKPKKATSKTSNKSSATLREEGMARVAAGKSPTTAQQQALVRARKKK